MDEGGIFSKLTEADARRVRRAFRLGAVLTWLLVLGALLLASARPYTEYLWYAHDVRRLDVFETTYRARGILFLVSFLLTWGFVYVNLRQALGATLVYLRSPENRGEAALANLVTWLQAQGSKVVRWVAPAFALVTAIGFANEWNTYLLARNAQPFGMTDPTYGIDVGFYVFTLPWYRAVGNLAFSVTLMTTLTTIGAYIGLQALAALARIELSRPTFRWHVSGLMALTLLALAAQSWLKTYEVGLVEGGQITGAGYAASQGVGALRIFAILAVVGAVATLAATPRTRTYSVPIGVGLAIATFYGLGVLAYPEIVQRFVVDPNRLDRERPFAERAIRMTRYAYGLDRIDSRDFGVQRAPGAGEVREASATFTNLRLWDPEILRQSLEGLQAFRPYYSFPDVDIDRYVIDGKPTQVMLAPRNLDLNGLQAGARNWINERLRYTHGYGVAVSRVNSATSNGHPDFLTRDVPLRTSIPITQPRIYFSDFRGPGGVAADEYAVVDTGEPELDYDTGSGSQTHRWTGGRGIPIGGLLSRLAFGLTLGDGNLIVSGNVGGSSRLLIRRSVLERAYRVFPFLRLDADPYLVIHEGRLVWILDAYTATDMVPYSAEVRGGAGKVNYLRNSVKITIDAYTGETLAYAMEPNEPLLRAYRRIYPGLIRDLSEVPAGLVAHFRYPEDLLSLQCAQLATYHVTDPIVFLTNSDAWEIASERDLSGQTAPVRPYYVQLRLPDEPREGFFQILPFSPRGRQTMIGWVAAHCDPDTYGRLTLYRFTGGETVDGPGLMEGNFSATPDISNINRQYNNEQSEILLGNLLVLPVGKSVVYAEPLFLRSRTPGLQAVPRLFRVILALNDRIVVGENLQDALQKLFAESAPSTGGTEPAGNGPARPSRPGDQGAREALRMLNEADAALRKGDFARYGELQKALRKKLEELTR
jgi:uncharacterized membrane protein (UPF0182 family)